MSKVRIHTRRTFGTLKRAWDEMDYAQRRLIELNFELPPQASPRREVFELPRTVTFVDVASIGRRTTADE